MSLTWSAPGRVNLIGEHLDYNGGPVLPFAIDRRTDVTITTRTDRRVIATSSGLDAADITDSRSPGSRPPVEGQAWARYVAGSVWAFTERTGIRVEGVDLAVTGNLPLGAGLSSSAALECATIAVLDEMYGAGLSAREIAVAALRAEQEFVGVPCGPMDQLASMLAIECQAMLVDTRTLEIQPVPLSLDRHRLGLLVVDTGVRHSVADGSYAVRRAECARAAGVLGLRWLSDGSPDDLDRLGEPLLRRRACHVVSETARVHQVVALLRDGRLSEIGPLLTASHRSLAGDFEVSSPELELAVTAALDAGALGARMIGAGFGGSALALCPAPDIARISAGVRRAFTDSQRAEPLILRVRPSAGAQRGSRDA